MSASWTLRVQADWGLTFICCGHGFQVYTTFAFPRGHVYAHKWLLRLKPLYNSCDEGSSTIFMQQAHVSTADTLLRFRHSVRGDEHFC
jgi:hypothetical protein